MTRATRRMIGSPTLLAVALIVGMPAMGHAQLFPNLNARRERPSCVQEPPFNAHVRRDYFGYYPTCWSRFPDGWACPCPNPELPNAAESFRKQPRDKVPLGLDGPDGPPLDGAPDFPGMEPDPNMPEMPAQGRSPFEIEGRPPVRPPLEAPEQPLPSTSPIPSPTGLLEMPKLPSPTTSLAPGSMALPDPDDAMLASAPGSSVGSPVRASLGPLPMPRGGSSPVVGDVELMTAPPSSAPAQASARKGVIGNLFNRRRR